MDPRIVKAKKRAPALASTDPDAAAALLLAERASIAQVLGVSEQDQANLRLTAGQLVVQGQHDRALAILRALIAIGDEHPLLPFLVAECLERTGHVQEAIAALEAAIAGARSFDLGELGKGAGLHLVELKALAAPA